MTVTNTSHPLFRGLTLTDGELALFSQCATNAVTAISEWTETTGVETFASPVSKPTATSIAELPAGTNCNGTVLPQRMIMIGVSEYSTLYLTADAKHLIENAILYLLGLDIPTETIKNAEHPTGHSASKFIHNGQLFIRSGEAVYDCTGRRTGN